MIISRAQAFIDRPDLLMAVIDKSGKLLWVNQAFATFSDYVVEDAIGQNFLQILSSHTGVLNIFQCQNVNYQNYINEQLTKAEGFKFEFSYFKHGDRHQGLSPSWLLIDGQPIPNQDGDIQEYTLLATDITSQKEQESVLRKELELQASEQVALNQSEAKLKAFLDNSPAIIYIKDLAGRYQWINREFEYVLQTSQAQISGKTDYDFLPAEVADKLRANDLQAIFEGIPINIDESVVLPNGNTHFYIATKFPLLDDQGKAYATGGISFDISDRKRNEDILRYYERIVSATTDCVALIDVNYTYQLINQTYIDWHGKGYSEIVGHSVSDLLGAEIFSEIKVLFDRCLEGEIQNYEGWIHYAKVGLLYVSATYSPFIDSDGSISGIVINVRNISDRKRIEEELRQSEEKFRKSFESTDIGIGFIALDHRYLAVNPAFCQMLGYSEAELLSLTFLEITYGGDLEQDLALNQKLLRGEIPNFAFEKRYVHKNGDLIWVSLHVSHIFDANQQPLYNVVMIQNISDRKLMEAELRQSESKQKAIISALPDLMMVVNSDGIYTEFISTDAFKVVAKSKNHIGLRVDETLPMSLAQRRMDAVRNVLYSGSMEIYEQEIILDGIVQIEEVRVVPYQDHEVLILVRDISDRKFAELRLQSSEALIRSILEAIPDTIIMYSADGIFLEFWEYENTKSLIQDASNSIGKHITELLPIEIALSHISDFHKAVNSGQIQIKEQQVKIGNQTQFEEVRIAPIHDDNVLLIIRNISDRKLAELKLLSSEARTRSILGAIPDIINMFSADGIFLESVGAYNSRDFIPDYSNSVGKHIKELLPSDVALSQASAIHKAATSGQSQIIEQQIEIDGCIQYEEVRVVPTQDGNALVIVRDISDRKLAEAALLLSEAENRAILAAIPDLIFQISFEGIYLKRFSTNFVKDAIIFDQNPVGKSLVEVLPANLAELKMYHLQKALETGENQIYEQEIQLAGKLQYEEVRIVKISERTALTMIRNITEQQAALRELIQAEAQLRQSEETNRAILAAIPDLLLRIGRDGTCYNFISPNHNQNNLFVPIINNISEVLAPDLFNFEMQRIEEALGTGNLQVWEHQIIKNGNLCAEEVRLVPCGQDQCLVIVRDISDRKLAEIAIQESSIKLADANAELNALFSAMTDVVLVRNSAGQCLKVAPTNSFSTLLGTPEEVICKPILEELPEQEANIILGAIAQALETGKTVYRDYKLVIQDREVWFSASISPISTDTVIQIGRDITERKQAEIALLIAKEEAEALAKAKSDFLANMSHEIRTPMNAVLGMAQLLSSTHLTEEQLDFVQTILDSGDGLLSIINDILDFSKIESGTLELESEEFSLEDILTSTFKLLSSQATNKNIHLASITQSDLPIHFIGDSSRLRQILINLVGNAIKFAEQGEVKVMVSGQAVNPEIGENKLNHYQLCFQVIDSGIGIESDRIIKLFQPFTQADASISRKYGGTGLGLAICKRLVDLMGGTIWVESFGQIGGHPPLNWSSSSITQGSSFYFTVGLETSAAIAHKKAVTSQELALNQKFAEQFPLRILLAEDNPVNQKVACFTLKKLGYKVDVANNGLEALRAVQSDAYDLVFMDLQMPEMDGLTATKMIRQLNPVYPWIVAMTANALPEDRQICLNAGMNDYISKPIHIQELMRVLSSCDRSTMPA